jgi:hypothetical protein
MEEANVEAEEQDVNKFEVYKGMRAAVLLLAVVALALALMACFVTGCTCVYITTDKWTAMGASCFQDVELARLYYKENGTNVTVGLRDLKRDTDAEAVKAVSEGVVKGIGEVVKKP